MILSRGIFRRLPGFNSIFMRCVGIMTLTTIVVAGVLSALAIQQMDNKLRADVDHMADRGLVVATESLAKPLRFNVAPKIEEGVTDLTKTVGENASRAVAVNGQGDVVFDTGEGEDAGLAALAARAFETGTRQIDPAGSRLADPVMDGAEGPTVGAVAFTWGYEATHQEVIQSAVYMLSIAATVFAVMVLITTFVLRRVLGIPLGRLAQAVERVSKGDYDTPVGQDDRKDEIGKIAGHLAHLVTELRSGREAEEQRKDQMQEQIAVVEQLGQALDDLANGSLDRDIDGRFPGDYDALRENYNRAVQSLRRMLRDVVDNAGNILGHANQISGASDDLSRRTETQAATLEQSAAALEEMLNAVKSAAGNAERANETVRNTQGIAERNGEVMQSAIEAMGRIEKSSEQISEIITVIDDIAFQTNLLALNAGVEAARAGESGKGFAVVASEVRGLAQRSAEAAQQIKDLILGSGEQVHTGVTLVENAGRALEEVLIKIADVSSMVQDIAESAGEQAQGLNEINAGIANLDRVTQQNAAMVEESTAAAHMMRTDAEALTSLVGQFETGSETSETPKGRAAAA